ncbi:hypothetical protein ACSMXM_13400 [Pacificimonas sp. ICDLI1SI03]
MSDDEPARIRLPRTAKGKRSSFYDDPAIDDLMTYLLEHMAETAALRERVDTLERLLEDRGILSAKEVEKYSPSAEVEKARSDWVRAFLRRVIRLHEPEA